jgi:hypothetical protein
MSSHKYSISGGGDLTWTLGLQHTEIIMLTPFRSPRNCTSAAYWSVSSSQDAITATTPLAPGAFLTKEQCPMATVELHDMVIDIAS